MHVLVTMWQLIMGSRETLNAVPTVPYTQFWGSSNTLKFPLGLQAQTWQQYFMQGRRRDRFLYKMFQVPIFLQAHLTTDKMWKTQTYWKVRNYPKQDCALQSRIRRWKFAISVRSFEIYCAQKRGLGWIEKGEIKLWMK